MSSVGAVLYGVIAILAIVPLSQLLTVAMTNLDLETASPAGWSIGILAAALMAGLVLRRLRHRPEGQHRQLVIVYTMLTIAVPVMNLGLIRPLFLSLRAVQQHFVRMYVNTYRTAYEAQSPNWFPVVPTEAGLAWNRAERLLQLLKDARVVRERENAKREALQALNVEAHRAARDGADAARTGNAIETVRLAIARMGADEVRSLLETLRSDDRLRPLAELTATDLDRRLTETTAASVAALARLEPSIAAFDERDACYVPVVLEGFDRSAQARIKEDRVRLPEAERTELDRRIADLTARFDVIRGDVNLLAAAEWARLRELKARMHADAFAALDAAAQARERTSFMFRCAGRERAAMAEQDGRGGTPNQNLVGLDTSLWRDMAARQAVADTGLIERLRLVWAGIPWSLWARPLLMWSALLVCLFLFLMCLAEWLRHKWVERENLAFPLVELADNLIRHDRALESAEDTLAPAPRGRQFAPAFLAGAGLGALIILIEALGHYGIMADRHILAFDVSKNVFTAGAMREMSLVFFVLSPVVVGLLFLVSLEVSFSIWALFFIYKFAVLAGRLGFGDIKDSVFTGWAGGRFYPFPMEQLLGASLCFTAILMFKAWRTRVRRGVETQAPAAGSAPGAYVPPRLTRAGLILLPLLTAALLWSLGLRHLGFMALIAFVLLALTIAAARVRAETGLYTQHVTYEFSKFPMVFGLTGWTGAKVYTTFISLAFLPISLLFRLLPQQLENIELARRNRVRYGTIAVAALTAFIVALTVGMLSFLVLCYYRGGEVMGIGTTQGDAFESIIHYPLWVSHFLGEAGLDQMRRAHAIRLWYVAGGFAVFGALSFLRGRLLKFPFHPLGYLLILMSTYYAWVSPYYKSAAGMNMTDASWLWGSALVAWLAKKTIIKYGGMNTYKRAKPFFIGLAAGAVICLFAVNLVDLGASLAGSRPGATPGAFIKTFLDAPVYNPAVY